MIILFGGFFYFRNRVYYSRGSFEEEKMFVIEKGQGNVEIAENLKEEGLVSGKICFYYYMKKHGLLGKILPGEYLLSGSMTIPEIARAITNGEARFVKITFPEGFTASQMADRLSANNLPGSEFLKIVNDPGDFKKRYGYLVNVETLEGYLFPDTYFFKKDASADNIVGRLLDTFDEKLDGKMRKDIVDQEKTINEIVIMASIVEAEVRTMEDRRLVAGIFWKRLALDMPLQSDATLTYAIGVRKKQSSLEDTRVDSPYNTYANKGFPPGPIGNPGLQSIDSAVNPAESGYVYFLSDPETGETVFSETFPEHVKNKEEHGL